MSDLLGDDVKKKNVRARIENGIFFYYNDGVKIGDQINLCRELYGHPKTGKKGSPDSATHNKSAPCHDLSQAPENICFYSRTDELAALKQWILKEHSRIITITGLSGIGKTALARQLVEDIKDNFDRILWRTHQRFPTLNALQSHLAEFFAPPSPTKNSSVINSLNAHNSLLDYLRSQRWLIILDDFQETLNPGEFIGNYCPEYQKYGQWIQEIGRLSHQSCLLLLSWEQPLEITRLETENLYCKTLQLSGLGKSARELLVARKLKDQHQWSKLIELYNGNPLWLNVIATAVLELFDGSVQKFLSYPTLI